MRNSVSIVAIIPALDEERTIGEVLDAVPSWVDKVVVADNGSRDRTAEVARSRGAAITLEPRRGYGSACLAGMREAERIFDPSSRRVVVFLDGDLADDPREMAGLVDPIINGRYEFVLGSRVESPGEEGALNLAQRFGNRLACRLIELLFGVTYRDLGPFRAIEWNALESLGMSDTGYGFPVQMQVRAARERLRVLELPVSYHRRAAGRSKISGTVRGIYGAGTTILSVIFTEAWVAFRRGELRIGSRRGRRRTAP